MRGLTILVAGPDPVRLRSALGLALSHAALGGRARLFIDTAAVPLLRMPIQDPADAHWNAGGMPALAALVTEALDADIAITLCQAGVAIAGATAADFDPSLEHGGLIGLLATLAEDRLVAL